jgi:hypothetical protein
MVKDHKLISVRLSNIYSLFQLPGNTQEHLDPPVDRGLQKVLASYLLLPRTPFSKPLRSRAWQSGLGRSKSRYYKPPYYNYSQRNGQGKLLERNSTSLNCYLGPLTYVQWRYTHHVSLPVMDWTLDLGRVMMSCGHCRPNLNRRIHRVDRCRLVRLSIVLIKKYPSEYSRVYAVVCTPSVLAHLGPKSKFERACANVSVGVPAEWQLIGAYGVMLS